MELIKDEWLLSDMKEFDEYLYSLKASEKEVIFTKNVVNTKLECLGIKTKIIDFIVRDIAKGNYIQFINLSSFKYHENTIIVGKLISKIKDINLLKDYLLNYCEKIDNWACTDCIKFNKSLNIDKLIEISKDFSKSKHTFVRRMSLVMLIKILNENYLNDVFKIIKSFKTENEYYVNMACAWLLCECFIKFKQQTYNFLYENNINDFVKRKTISKCCDSFRVSEQDKNILRALRQ